MAVVTTQQKVAALYTAIFNRAPDQAGLNFWTAQINAGTSFASIAAGFAQHEVFTTGIGALDNAGYVSALYTNILGSAGDTAGIAYWTARLAAGESKAAIVAEFVNGSLTIDIPALLASGGISAADAAAATIRQQTLTNKADVGIYFANTLGAASNLNPATVSTSKAGLEADPIYKASQAAIAGVDSTAASVQTAKDAIAVAAGSANPAEALLGHTFTLTTGADTFVGSASADTFNALTIKADGSDASTLTAFDSIDGGAGNDTLNIYTDTGTLITPKTLNTTIPSNVTVKNVETINYHNAGAVAGNDIDASKFVGATAINQIGTAAADVINLAAGTTAGFNGADLADLSVDGAATATSAAIALTGVKGDATNVVKLAVSGTALNSVTVAGTIAQHTATVPGSPLVPAVTEKFTATFGASVANTDTITFDGFVYTGTAAATAAAEATAFATAYTSTNWTVADDGAGTLTFTAKAAGDVANITTADFAVTGVATAPTIVTTVDGANLIPAGAAIDAAAASLAMGVTAGLNVESVAVNTAVATTLTVANTGTKAVSTVDASASAGAITYNAAATVANIKTGAGNDTANLNFIGTATANAATLSTGAGNDVLNVNVTQGAAAAVTATVDAGEGNDTVNLNVQAGVKYNVTAGTGDDIVAITGTVKTTDVIDGGAGNDTVSVAGQATARIADDFIVFNKVLTNFETLKFSSAEGSTATTPVAFDASKLAANYTTLDFATGSNVDNVGAQALVANGALNAEAAGYVNVGEGTPAATAITYAGTLNITEKLSGTVQAHADTVNLTVKGGSASSITANQAILTGEAKSATVTLSAGTDTKGTVATTDDTLVASKVTIAQGTAAEGLKDLASLTLSGNGTAVVNVGTAEGAFKLVNVDASGLNSVDAAGNVTTGLTYSSFNTEAETIKLGAGQDKITLGASTYGKVDVVSGLNLVASAADAKLVDATKSDILHINAVDLSATGALGFTTTQTDLDLALKDAATYSKANDNTDVAFHMGGNTYVFHDSVAGNGLIDATDTVVQITGQVNLDLLASSLAVA